MELSGMKAALTQKTQNEQTSHLSAHNHRYQINKAIETNAENNSKVHGFQLYLNLFDVVNDRHSETGKRC